MKCSCSKAEIPVGLFDNGDWHAFYWGSDKKDNEGVTFFGIEGVME
jgi:hypothetical protein